MNEKLKEKIELFKTILDRLPQGIVIVSPDLKIEYVNRNFLIFFFPGMNYKKFIRNYKDKGKKLIDIFDFKFIENSIIDNLENIIYTMPSNTTARTYEQVRLYNKELNQEFISTLTIIPLFENEKSKNVIGYLLYIQNMSDYYGIQDKYDKTKLDSITDALTGLYNKKYLYETLINEVENYKRTSINISLIIMDIDNFKKINDTYGHLAGDEVLKRLALIVKNSIRGQDIPCRFGGEEFIVILPGTNLYNATFVGERIRKKMEEQDFSNIGINRKITISLGLAELDDLITSNPIEDIDPDFLIEKADEALYYSKKHGKNQLSVYYKNKIYPLFDFYQIYETF